MPWFNVDDGFAFHRKAVRAGNAAIGLWTRAGSWCAGELTDGFVPDHMIRAMRGTAIQTQRLVDAGLWVRDDVRGGFQFHEWSESGRNPTRKEVEKRREEAAKRKQKSRGNQHGKSENSQVGESSHSVTDAGVTAGVTGGRHAPPPLPSPPSSSDEEEPSLRSGGRAKRSSPDRATTIPVDFAVSADMVEWARRETPLVDGRRATEAFRDHWKQATKNHRKRDWLAAWRNWMRKAQEDAEERQSRTSRNVGGQRSTTSERVSGWDTVLSPEARSTGTDGLALVYSAPEARALPRGDGQ